MVRTQSPDLQFPLPLVTPLRNGAPLAGWLADPVGNPVGDPIGNPLGTPAGTPAGILLGPRGDPVGNPLGTPLGGIRTPLEPPKKTYPV
ncbi:unnamed protein product [Lampetra planeri]